MPAGNIQPPAVHPDDEPLVCLAINKEWVGYLIGMVWPAKYPEYWAGTLEENRTARKDVMQLMEMISLAAEDCDMAKNCCVPPAVTYRIDPVTNVIVQSSDNGTSWQPAAGGIPSVIVQPIPPITSGVAATKCDAATNVQTQVQAWIDQVLTDFDTATTLLDFGIAVLEAVLAAVLAIVSAGTLTALEALILPAIGAALTAAWGAGKVAFEDYWTPEALTEILCAAYCNIGDDGSFTDAQFSAFWNKCNARLAPGPAKMLYMGFLSSVGKEGLNAMAASGTSADADCGDCNCSVECDTSIWSVWNGAEDYGTILERTESTMIIELAFAPSTVGEYFFRMKTPSESQCCNISHVEIVEGTDFNLNQFDACEVTQGGFGSTWTLSGGTGGEGMSTFRVGSATGGKLKLFFV